MKKFYLLSFLTLLLLTGCNSFLSDSVLKEKKQGIVDACYNVLEYNPEDKTTRLQHYLDAKVNENLLTEDEKYILQQCILRTESSKKWSANK